MLFLPSQDELDCINSEGIILGKIRFDSNQEKHVFRPADDTIRLSSQEEMSIAVRLARLDSGKCSMPTQDDD